VRQPKKYHDGIITYQVTCDQKENPKTVAEALSREDKEKWKITVQGEYKGLLENKA
jgi:hypothetical protein